MKKTIRDLSLAILRPVAMVDVWTEDFGYDHAHDKECIEKIVQHGPFDQEPETLEAFARWQKVGSEDSFYCACCGHGLIYNCIVEDTTTGEFHSIGRDCMDSIVSLKAHDARFSMLIENASKRQAANRLAVANRRAGDLREAKFYEANPSVQVAVEYARNFDQKHLLWNKVSWNISTIIDLRGTIRKKGALSEKQLALILRIHTEAVEKLQNAADELANKEASLAAGVRAPEGKQSVTGTLVSIKYVTNDFGGSHKGVIDLGNGTKVWGTIPESQIATSEFIVGKGWVTTGIQSGDKVSFTATFEASGNDPLFGFYKRPSKWVTEGLDARTKEARDISTTAGLDKEGILAYA
jgi:hypothetical protein